MSGTGQIYVRGYPRRIGEQDLKKHFSRFGSVTEVRLMRDFAFIVLIHTHRSHSLRFQKRRKPSTKPAEPLNGRRRSEWKSPKTLETGSSAGTAERSAIGK
jgi:RNA recognition motif-containing protein